MWEVLIVGLCMSSSDIQESWTVECVVFFLTPVHLLKSLDALSGQLISHSSPNIGGLSIT